MVAEPAAARFEVGIDVNDGHGALRFVLRVIVQSEGAPLYVANCRFFMEGVATYPIRAVESPFFYVRNSLFVGQWTGCALGDPAKKSLIEFDEQIKTLFAKLYANTTQIRTLTS